MNKHQVFFDGNCPLCKKEITLWQKLSHDQFEFINVHSLELDDLQKARYLRLLHIKCADGAELKGIYANFKLWRSHPIGWPSYLLSIPGIFKLTESAYNWWAQRRYHKKYECNVCH